DRLGPSVQPLGLVAGGDHPVEQAVIPRHGREHPDAFALGPGHVLAHVRFVCRGQIGGDRAGVQLRRELDEMLGDLLRGVLALRNGHCAPALTQFSAQCSLLVAFVTAHADILCRVCRYPYVMAFTITKAVIPAAGLGTRFLPATKAMPKEMLPVVDKPAIQYVVEEAVDAGLHDVLMITGRNKNALENHFDRNAELEETLTRKGDTDRLEKVNYSTALADMHYVRQGDPKGLGHAVLRAKMHVGREPFAVLLGDDIIDARDPLLSRMLEVQRQRNTTVVALLEVDPSQIHLYGAAAIIETDEDDVVRITGLVEKPDAAR